MELFDGSIFTLVTQVVGFAVSIVYFLWKQDKAVREAISDTETRFGSKLDLIREQITSSLNQSLNECRSEERRIMEALEREMDKSSNRHDDSRNEFERFRLNFSEKIASIYQEIGECIRIERYDTDTRRSESRIMRLEDKEMHRS